MANNINLQDSFLNQARKDNVPVTVFLMNGFQLKGFVRGFDSGIVVIESENKQQIIYKHAISTIIPSTPVGFNFDINSIKNQDEPLKD
ncbi:MAG: RNA chaperone Hfq [Peptococcaceae bacterium]|jgi:host factor-I protein|nr:RNA chaperone Hfq [Peptococcaceae bacterium]